jgi:DNA invertase Pin-like site-specific DNA recombinase
VLGAEVLDKPTNVNFSEYKRKATAQEHTGKMLRLKQNKLEEISSKRKTAVQLGIVESTLQKCLKSLKWCYFFRPL